jgi:hypothetical protein
MPAFSTSSSFRPAFLCERLAGTQSCLHLRMHTVQNVPQSASQRLLAMPPENWITRWAGERALFILCIALGAFQVWFSRYRMDTDGVSYLDVGDAFYRHDWARAVNAYWSPLYAWLEGLALGLVQPSMWQESIVVHLVNLLIYLFALLAFRFFLHSVRRAIQIETDGGSDESRPLPEWCLNGLGYCIFLWSSLVLIDVGMVGPDLLVEAFILLLGAYLVRLRYEESLPKFAVFGILCGVAYLAKAVMFPVSFGLLVILLFSGRLSKRRFAGVFLAGLMFLTVSAPFIAALSRQKGRLTFGDSGKLNYAYMVSPEVQQKNWQGDPSEGEIPKHPTRQLLDRPPVFEFAQPTGGTYPPWFDPSYWDDGAHGTWRLRSQIRVLVQSGRNYIQMLLPQLGLLTGIAIFMLWGGRPTREGIVSNWPLIAAGSLSIGLYSLVLVRERYVAGSFVLIFIAILASIRLPRSTTGASLIRYITLATMGAILFSVLASLTEGFYLSNTVYGYARPIDNIRAAEGLQTMGIHPGDPVASIGDGVIQYWARLGKFRMVAEVFSPDADRIHFWAESWERRKMAYECLRRAGAKVVVVWSPPESMDSGWKQIANTNYYAYFLTQ